MMSEDLLPVSTADTEYALDWASALARFNARAQHAYAPNSIRAHQSDWRVWTAWCDAEGIAPLPVAVADAEAFFLACLVEGRKRATLSRYMATLRLAHLAADIPNPLDTHDAHLMWRGILRDSRLAKRQKQAVGVTWDHVQAMLATLDTTTSKDARDAALLLLAYDTQMRLSELVALDWDALRGREPDGSGRVLVERSKTDQEGDGRWLYVSPHTLVALSRWRNAAALEGGAVFRSCPRSNKPDRFARRLGVRDVPRIFRRMALRAGLDISEAVSGHSLRVGKAQDLLAADATMPEIMRAGRWSSPRMPARYTEMLEEGRGGAARLAKLQGRTGTVPD